MRFRISSYRRVIQAFFLLLFLALLTLTAKQLELPIPTELFLLADPLVALTSLIGGAPVKAALLLSLVTVAVTLLLGRVFCGYVCPLGTIIDLFSPLSDLLKPRPQHRAYLRHLKSAPVLILGVVLMLSASGVGFLMLFDPIVLLTRTFAVTLFPASDGAFAKLADSLYGYRALSPYIDAAALNLAGILIYSVPRIFAGMGWIVLLFVLIIGLNVVAKRFWCRYLCPLGALLGLLSRVPLYRRKVDAAACASCLRCAKACDMDAVESKGLKTDAGNCTLCMSCRDACKQGAISHDWKAPLTEEMPSRRAAISTVGATVAAAYAIPFKGWPAPDRLRLIRPPGALQEVTFLSKCVRCGACLKVCPTNVLQPALLEYGADGLWTPHLDFRYGVCDPSCNACGRVCPTGAVEHLLLEEKQVTTIGIAGIDRERCIPWATGRSCSICQQVCPLPEKAIVLGLERSFMGHITAKPHVVAERCTGCGICQINCPIYGEKAIQIFNPDFKHTQDRFV